jgi:hypothetical protein
MLGNSADLGWNIEGTTNISKYLVDSPTIRGGDFANGNYVQMDETGINAFGNYVNTFKLDASDGSVTIRSSDSGQRVEIDGTTNTFSFFNSSGDEVLTIDDNIYTSNPGIKLYNSSDDEAYFTRNFIYMENHNTNAVSKIYATGSNRDGGSTLAIIKGKYEDSITSVGSSIDKVGVWGESYMLNGSADAMGMYAFGQLAGSASGDAYGIYAYGNASGAGTSYGVYARAVKSSGTAIGMFTRADDIGLRIADNGDPANDYTDFWTDTNGDLNIKPAGDSVYIWESAGGAGNYGQLYANTSGILVIEGGSGNTVYISDNFNVSGTYSRGGVVIVDASRNCDFNNVNADGSFQMDGSDIITSAGLQTGVLRTIIPMYFGLNGTISSADDWLRGINGTDPGNFRLPFDCTLIAATLRADSITMGAGDEHVIEVWVANGDTDSSFAHSVDAITLTSSDNGNYGAGNTGLSTSFSAGDAVRVFFDVQPVTAPSVTDPLVTLWFLTKAS